MRPGRLLRRALASDLVDRLFTPHGVDRHLELIDPTWTVREPRGEITAVRRQTERSATLTIAPNGAWKGFVAGQHVLVGVEIDGVIHHRTFSLAGAPGAPGAPGEPRDLDGTIELTVRINPEGRVSRHLVEEARVGDVVRLSDAEGDMVLPEPQDRPRQLLFVSGGSGITPNISMLRSLVAEGHPDPVSVLHYERTPADLCYRDELIDLVSQLAHGRLAFGFTAAPGTGDVDGHLSLDHLRHVGFEADVPGPSGRPDAAVYLCGPAPMLAAVSDLFAEVDPGLTVRTERFGIEPVDPALLGGAGTVTFSRSGVTAAASGTVLETAEEAGLEPAFGCRRGVCGTCTARKESGVVHHLLTDTASAADDGAIRPCVSVPVGDVVVDL